MKATDIHSRVLHEDGQLIDIIEPKHERHRNGDVFTYIHGFAEPNHWNGKMFRALAEHGVRTVSPRIRAGQDRRRVLDTVTSLGEFRDSNPVQRSVMAHSAGGLVIGGQLLPGEAQQLASEMEVMILSNIPLDPRLSRTKLVVRFVRNAIQELVSSNRSLSKLIYELGDMVYWSTQGNVLKEVGSISRNRLHENLHPLAREFGNRLKIVVDNTPGKSDALCPPEYIEEELKVYDDQPVHKKPQLVTVPYRHSPNYNMPHYMAATIRGLHNMPRLLRRLKEKFGDKRLRQVTALN